MFPRARGPLGYVTLLVALLALAATATTARGQSFQTIILDSPNGLDNGEGTGISRDGVVAGYGWENGDTTPRVGLRWSPAFSFTGEAVQMAGSLSSVVFYGIAPDTDLPFGAAVGADTGNAIHAIQVDNIFEVISLPGVFHGDWTDKNPPSSSESHMLGGSPRFRVGHATPNSASAPRMRLWDLQTGTIYDLHPSNFTTSAGAAIVEDGQLFHIAGWGERQGRDRALRWSFDSFGIPSTDLHPAGYDSSRAYGISSRWTVGTGSPANSGIQLALSFDISGNGTATSLDPSWSSYSVALGASESGIVGYSGSSIYGRRAVYWSDADPNLAVDLHQFLPPDYIASYAAAINDAKFIVGTAIDAVGEFHAVIWKPVSQFSLMFRPGFLRYGQIAKATLTLDKAAPKGGVRIRLSPLVGAGAHAWALQEEVLVPEGKTSVTFNVATTDRRPPKPVRATITATWGKLIRQATLTINP